jgi:hypothetical protein
MPPIPRGYLNAHDPERDEWVATMRQAGATLEEIGAAHASVYTRTITRERVRQIVQRAGVPSARITGKDPRRIMVALRDRRSMSFGGVAALAQTQPVVVQEMLEQLELTDVAKRLFRMRKRHRPKRHYAREQQYSDDEMLRALVDLAIRLRRTPSVDDINSAGRKTIPSAPTYIIRFGTLGEAQRRAGLIPNPNFNARWQAEQRERKGNGQRT